MWFGKRRNDDDNDEELSAHLAIEVKQLMEGGMPREAAEAEARRRFGNRALTLEAVRAVHGFERIGRFWQDMRYAVRVLRRAPLFTGAAVLSLALGIGAATAVLSVADRVLLRPLPYPQSEQLLWVGLRMPAGTGELEFVPSPDFVAWRRDNRVFQSMAAMQASLGGTVVMSAPEPAEAQVIRVSANFLRTLGVTPALGRDFRPQEETPNGPPVAILTDGFWRSALHARSDIAGKNIVLDGRQTLVAGVLPASFAFPADAKIDVLTTLPVNLAATHRDRSISTWAVIARLRPGFTIEQARANVLELYQASAADGPAFFRGNKVVVKRLREHRAGNVQTLLWALAAAGCCLLAIACANVANLLLARWSARSRELAVRTAIGAGRRRLARQLFLEIALLIAAGGAGAFALAVVAMRAFARFGAKQAPRLAEAGADWRVFGVAVAVCAVAAILFGGLPLAGAGRVDLLSVLQQSGRGVSGGGSQWLRRALTGAEIALSVVLLTGAALLGETLWHLRHDKLGFEPEHLMTVTVPGGPGAKAGADVAWALYTRSPLGEIPGTVAISHSDCSPVGGGGGTVTFSRSDRPLPEPFHRGDSVLLCAADWEYANAAGARMTEGRFFTEDDFAHQTPVAVVNQTLARMYFPGEHALGKQILGQFGRWSTVVGVIEDSKNQGLNQPAYPQVFLPAAPGAMRFLVRSMADASQIAPLLRQQFRKDYPGALVNVDTIENVIGEMSSRERFTSLIVSAFAAVAVGMALIGVYGVLAFAVAQRRQEIGIRMALGAAPSAVLGQVMRESSVLVGCGAAVGVGASLFLQRYLTSLLYGVKAGDAFTLAAVVVGLALAAAAASFGPARRAARVDPSVALREE